MCSPSSLKIELVQDIFIVYKCVKFYKNPWKNDTSRVLCGLAEICALRALWNSNLFKIFLLFTSVWSFIKIRQVVLAQFCTQSEWWQNDRQTDKQTDTNHFIISLAEIIRGIVTNPTKGLQRCAPISVRVEVILVSNDLTPLGISVRPDRGPVTWSPKGTRHQTAGPIVIQGIITFTELAAVPCQQCRHLVAIKSLIAKKWVIRQLGKCCMPSTGDEICTKWVLKSNVQCCSTAVKREGL